MPADSVALADRAVIAMTGADAGALLQRLVTNDVEGLPAGEARYAALLTPQGKIVTDFIAVAVPEGGFLLDVPLTTAADFARKLVMYRLRAAVGIEDRTATLGVMAATGPLPATGVVVAYDDPRSEGLWRRAIVERGALPVADSAGEAAYRASRIAAGVPEGGLDFVFGDAFPHEANLDHLGGVDFKKGCYVGQEVVSRVHHRGTARKRIVLAAFDGPAPPPGTEVMAGDVAIGSMGSAEGGQGLAMVRLDRLDEAGVPPTAGGVALRLTRPSWAS